ncbi:hypothetical protein [Kordiimonas marina]|uniref:hypothetical protein n=1 Tax=Kordiimonas marina TaxID=2872312 RepID=UPI001FF0F5D0|nr:hypothetical protein [Kordiimonas marina]MCJ9428416.1 hypothetical protein [Kordiimonas marina]
MIISYDTDSEDTEGNKVLPGLVNNINAAIAERIEASGGLANIGHYQLFGSPEGQHLLDDLPGMLNFTTLTFYFKSGKDPAGLCPMQGLEGTTDTSASILYGSKVTSQSAPLAFSNFDVITELTTFYAYTNITSEQKRYGRRLVALNVVGYKDGAAATAFVMPTTKGKLSGATDLASLRTKVEEFNGGSSYQIGELTVPMNLSLKAGDKRVNIINVGLNQFKGKSCYYIAGIGLYSGLPNASFAFESAKVTKVEFLLDFEQVARTGDGDFGSYEVTFQATNSNRNLEISQTGSTHTLTVPSVSVGVFQGASVGIGSPYSYSRTSMKSRQKEKSDQTQLTEKLTVALPQTYYQLKHFTGAKVEDVMATIRVTTKPREDSDDTQVNSVSVPLGQKLLLCATEDAVANTVVATI